MILNSISSTFLEAVAPYDGLEIEIIAQHLMVRMRKRIPFETAQVIVNFMARVCDGVSCEYFQKSPSVRDSERTRAESEMTIEKMTKFLVIEKAKR